MIELMLVLSVLTALTVFFADMNKHSDDVVLAKAAGREIAEYKSSVQKFLSYNEHGATSLSVFLNTNSHNSEASSVTFNGTDWLKKNSADCSSGLQGTGDYSADQSFLPCRFKDQTRLKQSYATKFWFDPASSTVEAKTVMSAGRVRGETRHDLTAYIVNAIDSSTAGSSSSDDSIFTVKLDRSIPGDATILLEVSNNTALSSWLRVDGGNKMGADLDVGGYSIVDAENGSFTGVVTTEDLSVTDVADIGTLNVTNDGTFGGGVNVARDITSSGGDIISSSGKVTSFSGFNITGAGDLIIEDGKIVLKNAAPSVDFITSDNIKRSEIMLTGNNELSVKFNSVPAGDPPGIFSVSGDIYNESIGKFGSQGVYFITNAANGESVDKPLCPQGKVAQIFTSASAFSRNDIIKPVGAMSTFAIDEGSNWRVYMEIIDEDGVHGGMSGANSSFPNMNIMAVIKCS